MKSAESKWDEINVAVDNQINRLTRDELENQIED